MRALKEASEKTRKTGQPEQAFSDSEYAVRCVPPLLNALECFFLLPCHTFAKQRLT